DDEQPLVAVVGDVGRLVRGRDRNQVDGRGRGGGRQQEKTQGERGGRLRHAPVLRPDRRAGYDNRENSARRRRSPLARLALTPTLSRKREREKEKSFGGCRC